MPSDIFVTVKTTNNKTVVTPGLGGGYPPDYASTGYVAQNYYPLSNPSGFATGIDASLFVRKTESGQFLNTGSIIKFSTILTSGVETQTIIYPAIFSQKPTALSCAIENNVDNLIYSFIISSVNTNGFTINFSDNLSSTGYVLYTTVVR
jgi:hypothetical protein